MSEEERTSPGGVLGRYQLLTQVARGGMGQIWLGRLQGARGFHKLVAIKTLLHSSHEGGRFERMLEDEARIASLIHHPNVVQTIELGEHEGALYLVMEWVDGEPLSFVIARASERGGVPLGVAVNLVAQTLRGLHAAHELCDEAGEQLGVVHRDVSPHNVLLTYTGVAKLLDFGIAKATRQATAGTATGEVKGKFAYMAPEQILGGTMDRRTDLFAAGILLYTLTVGRHPFKNHDSVGVLHAITSTDPVLAPSRVVPGYPPELEQVVMKALEKDIERRFATAEEMRLALERAAPQTRAAAEAELKNFVTRVLGDRAAARRDAIHRTLLRADTLTPSGGSHPGLVQSAQSASSLRAITVDRPTEPAPPNEEPLRVDSRAPLRRSRRRYQLAFLATLGVAGATALFAASRAAVESSRPAAVAPPEAPLVEPERQPDAADAGTYERALPLPAAEPAASATPSVEPVVEAVAEDAGVPKKKARPAGPPKTPKASADDLLAPDYAR